MGDGPSPASGPKQGISLQGGEDATWGWRGQPVQLRDHLCVLRAGLTFGSARRSQLATLPRPAGGPPRSTSSPPNQQATSGPGVSPSPSLTASGAPRALASRDPMSGVSTPSRKTASQRLGPLSPVLIRYRVFLLCLKTYFWFLLWRFQTVALAN